MDVRDKHNLPHHLKADHTVHRQKTGMNRSLFSGSSIPRRRKIGILCVFISILFLFFNQRDSVFMSTYRNALVEYFVPVINTLSGPKIWASNIMSKYQKLVHAYDHVTDLEIENSALKYEIQALDRTHAENRELHKILNIPNAHAPEIKTARIIAKFSGVFTQNFLINLGKNDAIQINQPVINQEGLLGRIIDVTDSFSRVLPVINPQSKVPARIKGSEIDTMLVGDGSNQPYLKFIDTENVKIGDVVVTSGKGGIFPALIPIGTVVSITPVIRVNLFIDFKDLYYVRLLPAETAIPTQEIFS